MALIFETRDQVIWDSKLESSQSDPLIITIKRDNPSAWIRFLILLKLRKAKISFPVIPPKMRLCLRLSELLQQIEVILYNEQLKQWEHAMRLANCRKVAEFIATFIYNKPKNRTPSHLTDFILDNVDEQSLLQIMEIISREMDITSFLRSIAQARSLDLITPAIQQEDEVKSEV